MNIDLLLFNTLLELDRLTREVVTVVVEQREALKDLVPKSSRPAIFIPLAALLLIKLNQPVECLLDKCIDSGWIRQVQYFFLLLSYGSRLLLVGALRPDISVHCVLHVEVVRH